MEERWLDNLNFFQVIFWLLAALREILSLLDPQDKKEGWQRRYNFIDWLIEWLIDWSLSRVSEIML